MRKRQTTDVAVISRRTALASGAAAAMLAGCSPKSPAAGGIDAAVQWAKANLPHSTPEIITAAAKEGHLMLTLLNQGGNTDVLKSLIKAFNARYPFVAVDFTAQSAVQLTNKFNAELAAGTHLTDYTNFPANLHTTAGFERKGAILPFVISDDGAFPAAAKHSGLWYASRAEYPSTAWRKGALSAEELKLIQTFEGLGDPRFKGRIAIGSIENTSTAAGCYILLAKEDPKIWQRLAANRPKVKPSGTALIDGLLAGEYDITVLGGMFPNLQAARAGAPLEFGVSAPFAMVYTPGGISALAPHPNAAKLWQDWVMSAEGQRLWISATGSPSVRTDIGEKSWAEQQPWFFKDASGQKDVDWDDLAARQKDFIAQFKKDMQAG